MWVRGAAIRPVPRYAVVTHDTLEEVEHGLATDGDSEQSELDNAFRRFERSQPAIAEWIGDLLSRPLDETALALGYFLSISVWLGFDKTFGQRLATVGSDDLRAALASVQLEEELRAEHSEEPLDLDDVMTIEQPGILEFINAHVEAALDAGKSDNADGGDVDIDDVHAIYRAVLVMTLALSHSVMPYGSKTVQRHLPA